MAGLAEILSNSVKYMGGSDITHNIASPALRLEEIVVKKHHDFIRMNKLSVFVNDTDAVSSFSDVNKNDWYYSYISTAKNLGIISGYQDNTFRPNDIVTRQDMALIIKNDRFKGESAPVPSFTDLQDISNYESDAVGVLYSKGVINGMGDGTFKPKNPATRAQAAQMIYNAMNVQSEE